MKDALMKLLKVKSLITVILTGLFTVLAVLKVIGGEDVVKIYMIIIAFYFGTQATKE